MRRLGIVVTILATLAAGGTATAAPARDLSPAGPAAPVGGGTENKTALLAGLIAAGDLDGDGDRDVLDTRQTALSNVDRRLGLTARDGRTGRALWSRTFSEAAGITTIVDQQRLGARGRPGFLLHDENTVYDSGGSGNSTTTMRLRAVAGRTGRTLWTRTFVGSTVGTSSATDVPQYVGPIHNRAGAAVNTLLLLNSFDSTPQKSVEALIVSGKDGSVSTGHDTITTSNAPVSWSAIPDVTGDGLDDLLLKDPDSGLLQAERGTDGEPKWTRTGLDLGFASVVPAGHVTAAGHDLALISGGPFPGAPEVTLLRGVDGHPMWTRAASYVMLVQRAGRDLRRALGVATLGFGGDADTTSVSFTLRAVTAGNDVLYRRTVELSVDKAGATTSGSGFSGSVFGDVQDDGAQDVMLELNAYRDDVSRTLRGIVNGRNGRFAPSPFDAPSDGSLHRGAATDLLGRTFADGTLRLLAWRGATRERYYRLRLGAFDHVKAAEVAGARLTGHRCSDVMLMAVDGGHEVLGVLSARGRVLWTVSFGLDQATGGSRSRHADPARFCV
jgi:hypothetical protein